MAKRRDNEGQVGLEDELFEGCLRDEELVGWNPSDGFGKVSAEASSTGHGDDMKERRPEWTGHFEDGTSGRPVGRCKGKIEYVG